MLDMRRDYGQELIITCSITDGNPQMWDLAAYRVLDVSTPLPALRYSAIQATSSSRLAFI